MDNLTRQAEEIEALSSIYGNDWTVFSESTRSYNVTIKEKQYEVILDVTMSPEYPNEGPPKYEFSAPWMARNVKKNLHRCLAEVYFRNIGEPIIYQWIEKIRDVILTIREPAQKKNISPCKKNTLDLLQKTINLPPICHGKVIRDRKSLFQGHTAEVHCHEAFSAVLEKLKQKKKIFNAKHNIYAYRIVKPSQRGVVTIQDCDDDGESHAGGRLLHLLQVLDQKNTMVVVTRWYGGIHLGSDRFRHIKNAARQVIEQAGFLEK